MGTDEYIPLSEVKELAVEKLHTHDSWIFLPGLEGMNAVIEIERRFYRGADDSDFMQIVTPFDKTGVYGLAIASKQHLSAAALAAFINSEPLDDVLKFYTATDLMESDVIILANPDETKLLEYNFYKWVGLRPTVGH
jgi:hypothetical protein